MMNRSIQRLLLVMACLAAAAVGTRLCAADAPAPAHELALQVSGKWEHPLLVGDAGAAAKLKAHPVLKVQISVPPESEDAWFQAKLAVQSDGLERTESPTWLLERTPGKAGIDHATLSWDTSAVVAKMPDNPKWFKIELVTQGGRARTVYIDSIRCEGGSGAASAEKLKPAVPVPTLATPYPDNEKDFPGKGPARKFAYMQGERDAFFKRRQADQGAIAFVGDSLTGGWKNLAQDFPTLKVANRGVGGDTSRNVVFRFKEDVLVLNPRAIVIEIGNNDLTARGRPEDTLSNVADLLAMVQKDRPDTPVVICSIPPSANPKAPVNADDRNAINQGLRKIASQQKNTYFCDLYAALANPDGSPKLEDYAEDKLHMNDAGHAKWAGLLMPIFEKLGLK